MTRPSHMGTKFLKVGNIDILTANQGQLDPKQPNLKSVLKSEVQLCDMTESEVELFCQSRIFCQLEVLVTCCDRCFAHLVDTFLKSK